VSGSFALPAQACGGCAGTWSSEEFHAVPGIATAAGGATPGTPESLGIGADAAVACPLTAGAATGGSAFVDDLRRARGGCAGLESSPGRRALAVTVVAMAGSCVVALVAADAA
jgi:hypothetical protein